MKKVVMLLTTWGVVSLLLCGFRIVTKEEFKQLQTPESPLLSQIAEIFDRDLTGQLRDSAIDIDDLIELFSDPNADFGQLCTQYGYRQSPDIQCNFPVKLKGQIKSVNTQSRRGTLSVTTPKGAEVKVKIGPVVGDTALRDVLKSVSYLDFNDQTVYGEFGEKINAYCLKKLEGKTFEPGESIEVLGAFSSWDVPGSPSMIQIAPAELNK